ncbi:MAG TPA: hypothetical protein VFB79_17205 [Candidatus Angelobacter sp.]|nr:hypothetical protein [Candidatus Angelobacter sp.]
MQTTQIRVFFASFTKLFLVCLLFPSIRLWSQDSPGRFEVGANLTVLNIGLIEGEVGGGVDPIVPSVIRVAAFGPGVEGDFNFGRHFALDGSYSWLPTTPSHIMTGLFGAKVGTRTQHFGFFGKVRPGFISFSNTLREATTVTDLTNFAISETTRSARLTERALDVGGVLEYYPARHWAFRWDFGDTIAFEERGLRVTDIVSGTPTLVFQIPGGTVNNFQFSTGVHYRF